ncbi:MAG: D-alanine--D-alanine ligase family protein [Candidatus Nanosyncoccaceae bacterium]|jgi:D-alanine-D-alanine ligase
MHKDKKTIAVIFGGQSPEHDISIITAHIPIIQSLLATNQYNVVPIYIAHDGSWYSNQAMNDMAYFKQADFKETIRREKKLQLAFDDGLKIIWPGIVPKTVAIDLVFPATHGTLGEDGSLMGLLRMANVPFVGCDLFASATAMDKVLTKQVISAEGVPVVPYIWFTKSDWAKNKVNLLKDADKLKWPLFVKPVHLGSSIAISKVDNKAELENAIEVAFHYDDKVLVEEAVKNLIEVTLPIMGNDELQFGGIERALNKTEFFNFDDKYMSGGKKGKGANTGRYSEIPAKISKELSKEVIKWGEATYRTLGCSGIARVDFLIDGAKNQVYVNEVNTLPGSLYHHNWKAVGVSNIDLVTNLVKLAEERFETNKQLTRTFDSDVLNKAGGGKI